MAKEKYINKGAYGCVYGPPIACNKRNKDLLNRNSLVGKLFQDKKEFQEEVRAYNVVNEIDPDNQWSLPMINACQANIKMGSSEIQKCPHINADSRKRYMQIIMPNGGMNLKELIDTTHISFEMLLHILTAVVSAVNSIKQHGYLHLDIKPQNILVSKDKRVYLIDYSLMRKADGLFTDDNDYLFNGKYIWYPPEFLMYYKLKHAEKADLLNNLFLSQLSKRSMYVYKTEKYGLLSEDAGFYKRQCANALAFVRQFAAFILKDNAPDKFINNYKNKIDIFSTGVTFLNILETQPHLKLHPKYHKLKAMLRRMVNSDPAKRITIEQVLQKLNKLMV